MSKYKLQIIVEAYKNGAITLSEFSSFVFRNVTEHDDFCDLPQQLLNELVRVAKSYPADTDEEGWAKLFCLQSVCWKKDVPMEIIESYNRRSREKLRRGVAIFRDFYVNQNNDQNSS